jgi:hypothetical protein
MDGVCKCIPCGARNFILVRPADKLRLVSPPTLLEINFTCVRIMGCSRQTKYVLISYRFVSLIKILPSEDVTPLYFVVTRHLRVECRRVSPTLSCY